MRRRIREGLWEYEFSLPGDPPPERPVRELHELPKLLAAHRETFRRIALDLQMPEPDLELAIRLGRVRVGRTLLVPRSSGVSAEPEEPEREEPSEPERERVPVDLIVRLDIDPNDASRRDDQFILLGSDGYRSEKTVADDLVPGDRYVDLLYSGLYADQSYSLQVIEAPGASPYYVFRDAPYPSLSGLSPSARQAASAASAPPGEPGAAEADA
jgi:hypothetical protein